MSVDRDEITSASSPTRRITSVLLWTPPALAAAYLVALFAQFGQLISATYLDADAASAPVIGQLYGGSPLHRDVVLGQMAWFSTLMFELATRGLPLHRQIWEAAPYAMALAAAALIAWGLSRVAGRWAAAAGGSIVICAAPHTLHLLLSLNDHSPTWFSVALLGGLLVLFEQPAHRLKSLPAALAIVLGGGIVGANMASDTLLIAAGIVPVLIALAAVSAMPGVHAGRPAMKLMLATLAVAVLAYAFTRLYMHDENVTIPANINHNGLAEAEAVSTNVKLWWQSIAVLGNGEFFGLALGFTSALRLISAVLALIAVAVLLPRTAWRETVRALGAHGRSVDSTVHSPATAAAAAAGAKAGANTEAPEGSAVARLAWCTFWGSSAVLLSLGFIVSSTPVDINSDRYLVDLIYAAAAIVPLAASVGWRQLAIASGVCLFAFTGLIGMLDGVVTTNPSGFPTDAVSGQVADLAKREHLTSATPATGMRRPSPGPRTCA